MTFHATNFGRWWVLEVSQVMGAPPVIIHFRLGFSHGNQPSSHWGTPWLWRPGTSGPKSATLQPWFMEVVWFYIEYIYEYDISYLYIYIHYICFKSSDGEEYIYIYICALVWYDCNKKQTYCVIRYFILSNINPYFFSPPAKSTGYLGPPFSIPEIWRAKLGLTN